MKKLLLPFSALLVLCFFSANKLIAQKDPLEKTWLMNGAESKLQMYKGADGLFYGKISWLKEPIDKKTGKPKTDTENPDEHLRNVPLVGLVIMKGFQKNPESPDQYLDGKIYDPSHGRMYCAKITYKGTFLDLRGYICHLSFLGRTEVWTLTDDEK